MQRDTTTELGRPARLVLGEHALDLGRGELLDAAGQPAALRAQALALLCVLGERAGEVVGKDELMRRVWGDVVVTEDSLVQAVGDIRRVLGDADHRIVRTVPRRGYRLQGEPSTPAPQPSWPAAGTQAGAETATPVAPPLDPAASDRSELPVAPAPVHGPGLRWPTLAGAALLLLALTTAALFALRWPQPPPAPRSLAILPFETDAPSAADDWLAAAITSDLSTHAARWAGVRVIGQGTMRGYRGKAVDPRQVAQELGVEHVLTGHLRREGEGASQRVRLALQLVDGASGTTAWSQLIDADRAELPGTIGDLAGGLARALLVEWGLAIGERRGRLAPHEVQADDLAMQGFGVFLQGLGPSNFGQARALFEQALAQDPDSRRALAGASLVNSMSVLFGWAQDRAEATARSEAALVRLEALEPQGHLALLARASLTNLRNDWPGLLAVSDTLIREYPNEPSSHHHRCSALLRLARFDDSIPACERALRISPRYSRAPIWNALIGMNEYMRGRPAAAAERARATVLANPRVPFYSLLLAAALMDGGRAAEARQAIDEMRQRHPVFDTAQAAGFWPSGEPAFIAGRDRILAHARTLGVP